MNLSPDQQLAYDALAAAIRRRQRIMCLVGPAGSGKTTLVRAIAELGAAEGREVQFAAPTGKAALRLREVTGTDASTIHGLLYGAVDETEDGELVFGSPKRAMTPRTLLIVDEASMVSEHLHREILEQLPEGASLLYVGDREQLPPVEGAWGPDFAHPTAALTEIHRQAAGNPIIAISATVRTGGKLPRGATGAGGEYDRQPSDLDAIARRTADLVLAGEDAIVLSWTRKSRAAINRLVRERLGFAGARLVVGDRVKVAYNNHDLGRMNGEILTVARLELDVRDRRVARVDLVGCEGRTTSARVRLDLIADELSAFREFVQDRDDRPEWLHLDYGYALTVHSSQGSEWRRVAFVIDGTTTWLARKDPETARRLVYTAVTRARAELRVFDVADDRRSGSGAAGSGSGAWGAA